jgi:hypothetical protein
MRAGLAYAVIGALLLAGGCGAVESLAGQPAEAGGAETTAVPPKPVPHENARFLVRGGDEAYRVNVRYVGMIGESVIAVRQGAGEAGAEWPALELADMPRAPSSLPFGADAWRAVALGVAEGVRQQQGICPEERPMQLLRESDGEVRTMYRGNREAWVVFAACPGSQAG